MPFVPQIGEQVEVNAEDLDDPQALAEKSQLHQLEVGNPIIRYWFDDET